jgi:hypothetical protein
MQVVYESNYKDDFALVSNSIVPPWQPRLSLFSLRLSRIVYHTKTRKNPKKIFWDSPVVVDGIPCLWENSHEVIVAYNYQPIHPRPLLQKPPWISVLLKWPHCSGFNRRQLLPSAFKIWREKAKIQAQKNLRRKVKPANVVSPFYSMHGIF